MLHTRPPFIFLIITVLLVSCGQDAPRNNVFDPQSELYAQSGTLQGQVVSKYLPYEPISGVKIELPGLNQYTISGSEGEYSFSQLMPGVYQITFSGAEFVTCVDTVDIKAGELVEHQVTLNGLPRIESVKLITRHIAHWQPTADEYVLDAAVGVKDFDGSLDIDSVYFGIPSWNFDSTLSLGSTADVYQGIFFNDVFGTVAFPEIQGEVMYFQCRDKSGVWGPEYPTQITRLIVSIPQTLSPAGLTTVDSLPIFRWSHFDAGFVVKYQVNIFRLDESAIPQMTLSSPVLADTTLRWDTLTPLASARYYWTLTVVDRYENISVSKEASFIVEAP